MHMSGGRTWERLQRCQVRLLLECVTIAHRHVQLIEHQRIHIRTIGVGSFTKLCVTVRPWLTPQIL